MMLEQVYLETLATPDSSRPRALFTGASTPSVQPYQLPAAWQREYQRIVSQGIAPQQALNIIAGQSVARVQAIARVIMHTAPRRSANEAMSAAAAILAASLETGIPVPWLMATGYFESRFHKGARGPGVTMRSGPYAGQVVNACGPGQMLWPYSGPYTDAAWRGPEQMNRAAAPASCQLLQTDERQAWRMTARMFQRLMHVSQGPGEGYRKAIGWYSAGSAWAGYDGQDYRAKHQQRMLEMQQLLAQAGLR